MLLWIHIYFSHVFPLDDKIRFFLFENFLFLKNNLKSLLILFYF